MWKPPAINEFIKIKELVSLGILLAFLLIVTYYDNKNEILLSLGKEKPILSNEYIEKETSSPKNGQPSTKVDYLSAKKNAKKMIFLDPQNQLYWLEEFKKLSIITGDKDDLLKTYFEVFEKTNNYRVKKYLFVEIVKFYQAQENYKELKKFLSSHYQYFLRDDEMAYFILKTALSLGDTSFSQEIALSIKKGLVK